jgi:hypothetical protein
MDGRASTSGCSASVYASLFDLGAGGEIRQIRLLLLEALAVALLNAQTQSVTGEDGVKVSDHVWAIMGWPNIAIISGTGRPS